MEKVEVPIHEHPLITFTGFALKLCSGCHSRDNYIYGGYRCNELGCESVFHKECAESLPEINHSSHPEHPLKLMTPSLKLSTCSLCPAKFSVGYCCSICDFKLDVDCARRSPKVVLLERYDVHQHQLQLCFGLDLGHPMHMRLCRVCDTILFREKLHYGCYQCKLGFHPECVEFYPEAYHSSHPKHPLKLLTCETLYKICQPKDPLRLLKSEAPDYADKKCLLCGTPLHGRLHHCDVSNFSICTRCMSNPPPLVVLSTRTHEHQLHLVPRRIEFTCNACGTLGDRSPYFCLLCNFMIHWECIDLPRVININRHDHRISYTRRLGHGKWKCRVCRKKVDGFYGAYSCSKCSNYVVHSRCATRSDVWDMIELEGTPEEPEEVPPFEVIDSNTIKHFSHDHNLQINKDERFLDENTLCQACVFQICSEPFYSCDQCDFSLHQKCANLPRKKRHVSHNQPFTLDVNSECHVYKCDLCLQSFSGFRYTCQSYSIDVRCGSVSEPFEHESHPHPLYYSEGINKYCNSCHGWTTRGSLCCDECDFSLDFMCALTPRKVMRYRYDDHPLFLSYGESSVDGEYWCEACETKVNPKNWFYTCNDCGVIMHISCVVRELTYIKPGTKLSWDDEVVPNTSICRKICTECNSRCKLPSVLKTSSDGVVGYTCSLYCIPNNFID